MDDDQIKFNNTTFWFYYQDKLLLDIIVVVVVVVVVVAVVVFVLKIILHFPFLLQIPLQHIAPPTALHVRCLHFLSQGAPSMEYLHGGIHLQSSVGFPVNSPFPVFLQTPLQHFAPPFALHPKPSHFLSQGVPSLKYLQGGVHL